ELIAHDCALHGNPSHSGIDDLEREYDAGMLARCLLYHYASAADGDALAARGHRVARQGEVFALAEPSAPRVEPAGARGRSPPPRRWTAGGGRCAACGCRCAGPATPAAATACRPTGCRTPPAWTGQGGCRPTRSNNWCERPRAWA